MDFIREQLEENRYILPTDMKLMRLVHNAEDAVEEINQFYRNFHSSRWLKHQFVIRMHHPLNEQALQRMQADFADLCLNDCFHQHAYSGEEPEEAPFSHLTRLAFTFNARDHGRLRELVDYINLSENWAQPATEVHPLPGIRSRFPKPHKKRPAIEIAGRLFSHPGCDR